MKHVCMLCLGLLAILSTPAYAQITPAWTRHLPALRWQEMSRKMVLSSTRGRAPFMDLSRRIHSAALVKTTDQNWLKHKIFYSGLFSRLEKDVLLSYTYPRATLGKLAYLYDKHAAFHTQLTAQNKGVHIRQEAFAKHQQILHELTGTLQNYYLKQHPLDFVSDVFSKEEIQRLAQTNQPTAYVLTPQELKEFAALSSLPGQQHWTQRKIETTTWETEMLLSKATDTLSPAEFEHYYVAQRRLGYFNMLTRTLQKATLRRPSAIVRYRASLEEGGEKLTDAQRGGKLLFERTQTDPSFIAFAQTYGPYAAAESLGAPYEIALQHGANTPKLLGEREEQRLRQLTPLECLAEVLPLITDLETRLAHLHAQVPADPSFYTTYYALYTRLGIYQTLAAWARLRLHLPAHF